MNLKTILFNVVNLIVLIGCNESESSVADDRKRSPSVETDSDLFERAIKHQKGFELGGDVTPFVTSYFQNLLGRQATASDISYWGGLLSNDSLSLMDFFVVLYKSEEKKNKEIPAAYQYFLGRGAAASEISYWKDGINAGMTYEGMRILFGASNEFYVKSGGTNTGFVKAAYKAFLNREADSGGLDFWTQKLNTNAMTRNQVIAAITNSPERIDASVTQWCKNYQNKTPLHLTDWFRTRCDTPEKRYECEASIASRTTMTVQEWLSAKVWTATCGY